MATDNIQVTAYLPEHLIEYLNKYCTEYGITRKKDNKPMLGTAIVDLLNIVANIPLDELTAFYTGNLPKNNLDELIEKKVLDSTLLSKLLDKVLSEDSLRARLEDALLPKSNPTSNNSTLNDNVPVQYFNDEQVLTDTLPSKVPVKSIEDDIKEADTGKGNHNDSADFSKSEDIPESEVIGQLPLNIDSQETIVSEHKKTPKTKNNSQKNDSKRAKKVNPNIKPLSQDILDKINKIPSGTNLNTEELCKAIGISKSNLSSYFDTKLSTYFKKEKTGNSKNSPATYTRL